MPWFPGAVRKEIPRFRTPMTPVRVNLHTAVSSTTSLYTYFAVPGRVCSHFYVREDGTVEQYVDTAYRAAADLDGNPDTISIETWDGYLRHWRDGDLVPAWAPAQVASLTNLLAWLLATHPSIPARLADDSRRGPSSHGVSWHRLGCDPWRQSGALRYSKARGKVCPGDARIAQIPDLFAAATRTPPAPVSRPAPEEPLVKNHSALIRSRDSGATVLVIFNGEKSAVLPVKDTREAAAYRAAGVEQIDVHPDSFTAYHDALK